MTWRVGRSVGRTVYEQVGPEPSKQDVLIGVMDTRALATEAVAAVNAQRKTTDAGDAKGL